MVLDPWASRSHFTPQNIPEIQPWEQAEKCSSVAASLLGDVTHALLLLMRHAQPLWALSHESRGPWLLELREHRQGLPGAAVAIRATG